MSPSEIVQHAHAGSPRYAEACLELDRLLTRMARGRVIAGRAHVCEIDPAEREDIVSEVKIKVMQRAPLAVADKGDGPTFEYLRRMLGNLWISRLREIRRNGEWPGGADDESPSQPEGDYDAGTEEWIHERQIAALLERLVGEHVPTKRSDYHEATWQTWADMKALVYEGQSIEELVERQLGVDVDRNEWVRARDRIFQQSKRLRAGMYEALTRLHRESAIDDEAFRDAEAAMLRFLRCQRPEPAYVRQNEEGAMTRVRTSTKGGGR